MGVVTEGAKDVTEHRTLPIFPFTKAAEGVEDVMLGANLKEGQVAQINQVLKQYSSVFSDQPGSSNVLDLTSDKPVCSMPYKLQYTTRESLKNNIDDMLGMRVIWESNFSNTSPVVIVKKPDGPNRKRIDYRKLNIVTVFDPEPMTTDEDLFQKLTSDKYFSKLDLSKGYW